MFAVWMLLTLLVILVALLAVPLEWTFDVQLREGYRAGESRILWLFGLVRLRSTGKLASARKEKPNDPGIPLKPRSKRRRGSPWAAISVDGFIERVMTWGARVLGTIRIHHLDVNARLGLGDAADTGRLWSVIGPLSAILALPRCARIHIEPVFPDAVLDVHSNGRVRIVPLRLIALAIGFLLSPVTVRAFMAMRSGGG